MVDKKRDAVTASPCGQALRRLTSLLDPIEDAFLKDGGAVPRPNQDKEDIKKGPS